MQTLAHADTKRVLRSDEAQTHTAVKPPRNARFYFSRTVTDRPAHSTCNPLGRIFADIQSELTPQSPGWRSHGITSKLRG
jgi:hypothetical protein